MSARTAQGWRDHAAEASKKAAELREVLHAAERAHAAAKSRVDGIAAMVAEGAARQAVTDARHAFALWCSEAKGARILAEEAEAQAALAAAYADPTEQADVDALEDRLADVRLELDAHFGVAA